MIKAALHPNFLQGIFSTSNVPFSLANKYSFSCLLLPDFADPAVLPTGFCSIPSLQALIKSKLFYFPSSGSNFQVQR